MIGCSNFRVKSKGKQDTAQQSQSIISSSSFCCLTKSYLFYRKLFLLLLLLQLLQELTTKHVNEQAWYVTCGHALSRSFRSAKKHRNEKKKKQEEEGDQRSASILQRCEYDLTHTSLQKPEKHRVAAGTEKKNKSIIIGANCRHLTSIEAFNQAVIMHVIYCYLF